ncbi:MAG: hypothetical protein IPN96_03995 [Anaerolineales bacterium]|nr:hypothetical protein [Anaerolineales bacterium]
MSYEDFVRFAFGSFIVFAVMLLCQSYVNIAKKRFSKFSIDAIMLIVLQLVKGSVAVKREKRDFQKIRKLGYYALASAALCVYYAIEWYVKYIY